MGCHCKLFTGEWCISITTGIRDFRDQIQTVDGVESDRVARSVPFLFKQSWEMPISDDDSLDLVGAQIG